MSIKQKPTASFSAFSDFEKLRFRKKPKFFLTKTPKPFT